MSIAAIIATARGAWAFFTSPLGKIVGLVLIGLALYGAGFIKGGNRADLKCRTAQLQAEADAKQRDLTQADLAAGDDDQRFKEIEASATTDRERIRAYRQELSKRKDAACVLNADDLRRLHRKPGR